MSRTDEILEAAREGLEAYRAALDSMPDLKSVVLIVHLVPGAGHPRSAQVKMDCEKRLGSPKKFLTSDRV